MSRIPGTPLTASERAIARELKDAGWKYFRIACELDCSVGAVGGIFYRDRHPGSMRPVGRPGHTSTGKICWVAECDAEVIDAKFCDKHAFKPRTDFPASKLQGRRA